MKIICEVADGVLGTQVINTAWNTSKNGFCLIERKSSSHKYYLSDIGGVK